MKAAIALFSFLMISNTFASSTGNYICSGYDEVSNQSVLFEVRLGNESSSLTILEKGDQRLQAPETLAISGSGDCQAEEFVMRSTPMSDTADYSVSFKSNCSERVYDVSSDCVFTSSL